jgi:ribose transport system substrate-binding protein
VGIKRSGAATMLLLAMSLLAACSSNSTGTSQPAANATTPASAGSSGTGNVAAATAAMTPYLTTPSSIGLTTALNSAPPKGLTVAYLEGNITAYKLLVPGLQAATAALGWHLKIVPFDTTNPTSLSAAVEQAVAEKVNFILESGVGSDQFSAGLAAAQAAHIPVVEAIQNPEQANGVIGCVGCQASTLAGEVAANWIISDSGGKANVLFDTDPEFTTFTPLQTKFLETIHQCGGCTSAVQQTSTAQLESGATGPAIVSYLQSHPEVNYIFFSFSQLSTGVRSALNAAGVGSKVKIITAGPVLSNIQSVIDGSEQAAFCYAGIGEVMWRAVDLMARYQQGMSVADSVNTPISSVLWTTANVPKPATVYDGATNYQAQYKALWHVS